MLLIDDVAGCRHRDYSLAVGLANTSYNPCLPSTLPQRNKDIPWLEGSLVCKVGVEAPAASEQISSHHLAQGLLRRTTSTSQPAPEFATGVVFDAGVCNCWGVGYFK